MVYVFAFFGVVFLVLVIGMAIKNKMMLNEAWLLFSLDMTRFVINGEKINPKYSPFFSYIRTLGLESSKIGCINYVIEKSESRYFEVYINDEG